MNEELISKKELLEITKISYGQLYRWKRKKLIPEEWFIRKSTFTGQETFFPKDKIIDRINKIKNMKDDLSLDQLADVFSENIVIRELTLDSLITHNIVSSRTFNFLKMFWGEKQLLSFTEIICSYIIDSLLINSEITLEEAKLIIDTLNPSSDENFVGTYKILSIVRKFGISFIVLGCENTLFDKEAKIIASIDIEKCIEELKLKKI
ncbi:DUF4004 family protein [Caldicellulosiruptoraceae bacterium PP1]